MEDMQSIIQAFVYGAADNSEKIKIECAHAISFLITHQLVFTEAESKQRQDNSGKELEFK